MALSEKSQAQQINQIIVWRFKRLPSTTKKLIVRCLATGCDFEQLRHFANKVPSGRAFDDDCKAWLGDAGKKKLTKKNPTRKMRGDGEAKDPSDTKPP